MIAATTACNRPHPTSLGLATSLVEGGATGRASLCQGLERRRLSSALMWDSPSVVAGEEGCSSPVPNDRRGRRPHHSGAGLLRPVIPATCATVSLDTGMVPPGKSVSDSESDSSNDVACFPPYRLLLTGRARRSAPRIRGGEAASQGPFARPEALRASLSPDAVRLPAGASLPLCPPRPTRVVLPTSRNPSLSPHGPQVRSDGQRNH